MSQLPIGDGDQVALQGADAGGAQTHLLNGAIGPPHYDAVAHFKGLVHEEHEGAKEVFEGILGRQSQGKTANAQAGKNGSDGFVAEDRGDLDECQNHNGDSQALSHHWSEHVIQLAFRRPGERGEPVIRHIDKAVNHVGEGQDEKDGRQPISKTGDRFRQGQEQQPHPQACHEQDRTYGTLDGTKGNGQDRGIAFVQMIRSPAEKILGNSTCHKGDQYGDKESKNFPDFDSGDRCLCQQFPKVHSNLSPSLLSTSPPSLGKGR